MSLYRSDLPLIDPEDDGEDGLTSSPGGPAPDLEPDDGGFPEGGGAGGAFDNPDDLNDDPEPAFDDDPYDQDPYNDSGEDDQYLMNPRPERCMQARWALWAAEDQIETDERALDRDQENLTNARRELVECGSTRGRRYFVIGARGRWREETCEDHYLGYVQRLERSIAMRQNRIRTLRAQLPALEQRVRDDCP